MTQVSTSTLTTAVGIVAGERVEVRRSARRRRTVTAYREQGRVVILIPQRFSRAQEQESVAEMVAKVQAKERDAAPPACDEALTVRAAELAEQWLAPRLGRAPEPSAVQWVINQNQRWGSCTPATGVIRLSHRMRTMPCWVVDYVLLHELAHLVEANHSSRFWTLLADYPRTEEAKGFLAGYVHARNTT